MRMCPYRLLLSEAVLGRVEESILFKIRNFGRLLLRDIVCEQLKIDDSTNPHCITERQICINYTQAQGPNLMGLHKLDG